MQKLPGDPGIYILSFDVQNRFTSRVGKLGEVSFPAGRFFYCGSARGKGGVNSRIRHHLLSTSAPHWHLDHLRSRVVFTACHLFFDPHLSECDLLTLLMAHPGSSFPVAGFGSSDCVRGCASHLVMNQADKLEIEPFTCQFSPRRIMYNCYIIKDNEVQ